MKLCRCDWPCRYHTAWDRALPEEGKLSRRDKRCSVRGYNYPHGKQRFNKSGWQLNRVQPSLCNSSSSGALMVSFWIICLNHCMSSSNGQLLAFFLNYKIAFVYFPISANKNKTWSRRHTRLAQNRRQCRPMVHLVRSLVVDSHQRSRKTLSSLKINQLLNDVFASWDKKVLKTIKKNVSVIAMMCQWDFHLCLNLNMWRFP